MPTLLKCKGRCHGQRGGGPCKEYFRTHCMRMMRVLEVHVDEFVWQDRLDQMNHTPWLPPCFTVGMWSCIQVVFIYECQPCADSVGFDTIMHIASILSKGRKIPFQGRREGIYFPWIIQGKWYSVFWKSKARDMRDFGDFPHTGFTRHTGGVQKEDLSRNPGSYRCRDAFSPCPYHPAAS